MNFSSGDVLCIAVAFPDKQLTSKVLTTAVVTADTQSEDLWHTGCRLIT